MWGLVVALLILHRYPNLKTESKNALVFILAIVFIYFSTFRFELGQDYENYAKVILENSREYGIVEPFYTLLVKGVFFLGATKILFFLVYALVTNFLILTLSEFGYFTLVATASIGLMMLSGPISKAVLPRMTALLSEGYEDEMLKLYRQSTRVVVAIIAPIILISFHNKS